LSRIRRLGQATDSVDDDNAFQKPEEGQAETSSKQEQVSKSNYLCKIFAILTGFAVMFALTTLAHTLVVASVPAEQELVEASPINLEAVT